MSVRRFLTSLLTALRPGFDEKGKVRSRRLGFESLEERKMLAADVFIDDGEPDYVEVGTWIEGSLNGGFQGDYRAHAAGDGTETAEWTVSGLQPGQQYQVFATWISAGNRATNAPYTVFDGDLVTGQALQTIRVSQQATPNDDVDGTFARSWESLGVFTPTGDRLSIRLSDDANGYVIADGIRVVEVLTPSVPPEQIDDGDSAYAEVGDWMTGSLSGGFAADYRYHAAGDGSAVASWNFEALTPDTTYEVLVSWVPHANRATDAPFTVINGTEQSTTRVNQQLSPNEIGSTWERIAVVVAQDSTIRVELSNDANGFVIADAVRIVEVVGTESTDVVDDGDLSYADTEGWLTGSLSGGYQGDYRYAAAGSGLQTAEWVVSGLASGEYEVYATWVEHPNRASNAHFLVLDNATARLDTRLDQRQLPTGLSFDGRNWQQLGVAQVDSGTLRVLLDDDADGYVIADAIHIVPAGSAANQAPEIAAPVSVSGNEDSSIAVAGVSVTDADAGTADLSVGLSVSSGSLSLGTTAGLVFVTGDGSADAAMNFTGSLSSINSALAGLTYQPEPNFNGSDTIEITVDDLGNSGTGGALQAQASVAVTINAVNDPPSWTVPSTQTAVEGQNHLISGIAIDDADVAPTDLLEVSLSTGGGQLTLATTAGLAFSSGDGAADTQLTFQGTLSNLNQALATLTFLGTADDSISLSVSDLGNQGAGGPLTAAASIAVVVQPLNQAPSISAPSFLTVDEDQDLVINGLAVDDPDAGDNEISVTLTAENGLLTLSGVSGLTFATGDGTADQSMSFTGTLAAANAALSGLVYRGNVNFDGDDTVSIEADDLGNSGYGGSLTASETIAVALNPVNDSPSIAAPTAVEVDEDTDLSISGVQIDDPDSDYIQVTLAAQHGVLSLSSVSGLSFLSGDGTADASMTFQGSITDINAALFGLVYRGDQDYFGDDTVDIVADDSLGYGGELPATESIAVAVAPVDDAPRIVDFQISEVNQQQVTVTGRVVDEAPGGLTVQFAGVATGSVVSNEDGTFSAVLSPSQLGAITATVTDAGGATSDPVSVTVTNQAPQVLDFAVVEIVDNFYSFTGRVTDESAEGLTIVFGGLLEGYTTVVQADGTFSFSIALDEGVSGGVTAQTTDWWNVDSNLAETTVLP